jgi:hypothetical protein
MPLQGSLSIERMCQLAGVSRRSFYRSLKEPQPAEEGMEVRSTIQQIALEHRRYGCRRVTSERDKQGMLVNQKWRGSCGKMTCWASSRSGSW